jgi:hypothetical protein
VNFDEKMENADEEIDVKFKSKTLLLKAFFIFRAILGTSSFKVA